MFRLVLAALIGFATYAHSNELHFLCKAEEQLVFGCSLGEKQVSVCASPNLTLDTGYVQYRFGIADQLEQVYPRPPMPPEDRFFLSTVPYAGGGASALRFRIDDSDYFVFEQTIRTHFAPGEPHDTEFRAGLTVRNRDGTSSTLLCEDNNASIRKVAYDHFPREEYTLDTTP